MRSPLKSLYLLLVLLFSLMPFQAGRADFVERSFEESRYLLYLGQAFLTEEASLDTAFHFSGQANLTLGFQPEQGAEEVMGRMIHAAKQERNDLDTNCRLLKERYQSAGDRTAVRKLESYCKAERQRLSSRISFLRKLRGDRRKIFTRWWHAVKRGSANLWWRIGPVGRSILRRVGDEAFNVVVSGGSLNVGGLLKQAAESTIRDKLTRVMYAGVARMLEGQVEIARAAGLMEESSPESPETNLNEAAAEQDSSDQQLADSQNGEESLEEEDQEQEPPRVTASGTLSEAMSGALNTRHPMGTSFQLTADFAAGTISGSLEGSRTSTPGGWMNCFDPGDPSVEFDRIDVNTTESYTASFSGALDPETGEFSIAISPVGGTSGTKVSLFTHERCLNLNSRPYSGDQGWNGEGTISGGVSRDGGIEFSTSWTYSWFKGEVAVTGSWSGNGFVEQP